MKHKARFFTNQESITCPQLGIRGCTLIMFRILLILYIDIIQLIFRELSDTKR